MKIVFCLPGKSYSREFILSWTDLVMQTASRGHNVAVSQNVTLNASVGPIVGSDYDAVMLIGHDIAFRPTEFFSILESPHDVTTGVYLKEPTLDSPDPMFEGIGVTPGALGDEHYVKVENAGFGWLLLRKGILESVSKFSEDSFFSDLKNAGHEIYADTTLRVGHRVEIVI